MSRLYPDIERLMSQNKKLVLSRVRRLPDRGDYLMVDQLSDNFMESEVENFAREVLNRYRIPRQDEDKSGDYLIIKVIE